MADGDIAHNARLLWAERGDKAHADALKRGEAMLALGDVAGCTAWIKVAAVIQELERGAQAPGDAPPRFGLHGTILLSLQRAAAGFLFTMAVGVGRAWGAGCHWLGYFTCRR
jgi:hypothetical protein